MSQQTTKIPVVFIVGPTAVGKTSFAIRLAKAMDGEIVSADSRYFYRGMDIGTAKPDIEERQGIPHHLIDVADPDQTWSLARFQNEAHTAITDIYQRDKLPVVVGGTGQYVRAVLEGWSAPEGEPDYRLRQTLENWGNEIGAEAFHQKLRIIDPVAASNIEYQNMRRTVRAFEVIFTSGILFSTQRTKKESPYASIVIGLKRNRQELYTRIDTRIESMIKDGLIEETELLLQKGYTPSLPAMSAIGYREIVAYLSHECTIEEAIVLIKRRTHEYVRRQANWFKESNPDIIWYDISE